MSVTRTLGTSAIGLVGAIAVLACSDDRPASLDPAGIATTFDGDSPASSTASSDEATTGPSDGATSPAASEDSDEGRPGPASSSGVVEDTWASAEEGDDAHAGTTASVTAEDGTGTTHEWDDPGTDATTARGGDDETGADPPPTPEPAQFPPPETFGDDLWELDLVGTWSLNWDPSSGADSVLTIDEVGNFAWRETSADCTSETLATGVVWVEGLMLVMHVETWERQLPWDTMPVMGEIYEPPFRMRTTYSVRAHAGEAWLAISGPEQLTEVMPFTSRAWVRLSAEGEYLGGHWHGEIDLQALVKGEPDPVVIVRDRFELYLEAEKVSGVPDGIGVEEHNVQYFPIPAQSWVYFGGNWTCLDECAQPWGTTLINGSNVYLYGVYSSESEMLPFASGRAFLRGVDTDC